MTELDKLEKYLQKHGYKYERYEHFPTKEERERAYGSMSADAAETCRILNGIRLSCIMTKAEGCGTPSAIKAHMAMSTVCLR